MLPPEPAGRPPRAGPRPFTWLLLLLLALVAWGLLPDSSGAERELATVQAGPPPVVEASGRLAAVFEAARPATVRIEARCSLAPASHAPMGIGTGFFIADDGLLLTAYHVVRSRQLGFCPVHYTATTVDGDVIDLDLLGFDAVLDVALMQAQATGPVPWLELADSLPPSGSGIVAIGNSRDDFLEDRAGTVLRRNVTASQVAFASGTVETTASLAPGDSGGPVLTGDGKVVGVVSYISYLTGGEVEAEGLIPRLIRSAVGRPSYTSYAVPVLQGSELLGQLLAGGRRDIPVIGFSLQYDYVPARESGLLGPSPGVVVGPVQPGGPGADAGLRSYSRWPVRDATGRTVGSSITADVIVALNGFATPDFDQLLAIIYEFDVGDTVTLTVQRGNDFVEIPLTLGARRDVFGQ